MAANPQPLIPVIVREDSDAASAGDAESASGSTTASAALQPSMQAMHLRSGYAVEAIGGSTHEALQLRAPDGQVCLRIELTPQGPMVQLSAASLSVSTRGSMQLDCDRLEINAREGMSLQTAGRLDLGAQQGLELRSERRLDLRAGGDLRLEAAEDLRTRADAQYHEALEGDLVFTAEDDVMLDGRQVRMNSPRTPGEAQQRLLEKSRGTSPAVRLPPRAPHAGLPAARAESTPDPAEGEAPALPPPVPGG